MRREARLSVADQGSGIPADALPHLFERFYRGQHAAAEAGLGLGLYISRMLVEAHGGRIWAVSEPGAGSTFTVALPRLEHALVCAPHAAKRRQVQAETLTRRRLLAIRLGDCSRR